MKLKELLKMMRFTNVNIKDEISMAEIKFYIDGKFEYSYRGQEDISEYLECEVENIEIKHIRYPKQRVIRGYFIVNLRHI